MPGNYMEIEFKLDNQISLIKSFSLYIYFVCFIQFFNWKDKTVLLTFNVFNKQQLK